MIPYDLHNQWSNALYLAPLALLFWLLFWHLYSKRQRHLENAAFANLVERSRPLYAVKIMLLCVAWILMAIALAQPVGNGHYSESALPEDKRVQPVSQQLKRRAHDVILLIDASASMSVTDGRQGKSRLAEAQEIADELIRNLNGQNVALWAFTSTTSELSPPTMDYLFVRFMLGQIQINEGGAMGTDLYAALAQMRRKFFSTPSNRLKTLIVLSDGGDTTFEASATAVQQKALMTYAELFSDAASQKLRVYTIGTGSHTGGIIPEVTNAGQSVHSKLDPQILQKISEVGRGHYYRASDFTPLKLAEEIQEQLKQDPQYIDKKTEEEQQLLLSLAQGGLIYDHYFQLPLGIALLLLSGVFLLPDSTVRRKFACTN